MPGNSRSLMFAHGSGEPSFTDGAYERGVLMNKHLLENFTGYRHDETRVVDEC